MTIREQEIRLEKYLFLLYGEELSKRPLSIYTKNFIISSVKDKNDEQIITLHANRISSAKKIEFTDANNFHDKWDKNVEQYDLWLLEKIYFKLKELKIYRICVAWNLHCLFEDRHSEYPRVYKYINGKWKKELS